MSQFPELDDFDSGFTTNSGGPADDVDSFLARERALLGDDAGAFGSSPAPTAPATSQTHHEPELLSPTRSESAGNRFDVSSLERDEDDFPPVNGSRAANNVSVTAHDDVSAFERQFPEVEVEKPPVQQTQTFTNGYGAPPYQAAPASNFQQNVEPDSEPVRAWREKQSREIKQRDDEANEKREETITRAQKAIDDFYTEYNQKKEKQIAKNKEEEANFLDSRNDALAKGTTWQRISDLCDLQDSRSKTNTRSTKDLSRMKEMLLSLKREGENAPGAAGY